MVGTMEGPLSDLVVTNSEKKILAYFTRINQDERLYAIGFCDLDNTLIYETQSYRKDVPCQVTTSPSPGSSTMMSLSHGLVYVTSASIESNGRPLGRLLLLHDMSFIEQRSSDTKWYIFYLFVGLAAVISLITAVVSSLHDGMNLVAKEFVGARDDEQGVLILSQRRCGSRADGSAGDQSI